MKFAHQDLVHPAQRLERVQVVLGLPPVDVAGLAGQLALAGWIVSPRRFEHRGHRMLREPVDLEVRARAAQLVGDRDVAPGVAEADRRGDVQRARCRASGAVQRAGGGGRRRRGRRSRGAAG